MRREIHTPIHAQTIKGDVVAIFYSSLFSIVLCLHCQIPKVYVRMPVKGPFYNPCGNRSIVACAADLRRHF